MLGARNPLTAIVMIVLCGVGLWFIITRRANFDFGGSDELTTSRPIHVNAGGLDAAAVGCVFIALGFLVLAQDMPGQRRIPVFWAGAGLMMASILYGIGIAVWAVISLIIQIRTGG